MSTTFKVGDRVRIAETSPYFNRANRPTDSNPPFIGGTVRSVTYAAISVNWDNGTTNGYGFRDLLLLEPKTGPETHDGVALWAFYREHQLALDRINDARVRLEQAYERKDAANIAKHNRQLRDASIAARQHLDAYYDKAPVRAVAAPADISLGE